MVPGPDCMEDGRMCPNGIHHAAPRCYSVHLVTIKCMCAPNVSFSLINWFFLQFVFCGSEFHNFKFSKILPQGIIGIALEIYGLV